ncbi:MAG: ferritin [bacterium]
MLKKSIEKALNNQIKAELDSAYVYLSMSAHCESANLGGFAHWLRQQYEEEMSHAMRLFDFVHHRGGKVTLQAVAKPAAEFGKPLALFKEVLKHEQKVTVLINKLYELSVKEKDYPTQIEMQWFITEQVEEENTANDIIEQLKLVGDHGASLHRMDRILAKRGMEQ